MKLRNKKTGETVEIKLKLNESLPDAIRRTIEEAGWECEEPKEFWYISQDGLVYSDNDTDMQDGYMDRLRVIGNYFETKEEAKKAVEKLKAWKTLRDNKVHFGLATLADETTVTIFARKNGAIHEYDKELFLLFGENDIGGREE